MYCFNLIITGSVFINLYEDGEFGLEEGDGELDSVPLGHGGGRGRRR